MAEVKWIKITTAMFNDEKIRVIESMPEADSILVIWIKLLTLSGKINSNGFIFLTENIPYTDEMLSTIFNRPLTTVRLALETFKRFGMVEYNEANFLHITNWDKHQNIDGLDRIREQNRLRQQKKRIKSLPGDVSRDSHVTVTQCHATDLDLDKEKENTCPPQKKPRVNVDDFFESIWKLYPKKEGKGQVSKTQKEKLHKIGYEELERCVKRYKEAKNGTDKQYLQNGSTFFNSGYVDYLDNNFERGNEAAPQQVKPIRIVGMVGN